MNDLIQQAKDLLSRSSGELAGICEGLSSRISPEDFAAARQVYDSSACLSVIASRLIDMGSPRSVEGVISVDNAQAKVTIAGIDLRGDMEFEILREGAWLRGRRENSQYGQIFTNRETSFIISSGSDMGRVNLPLRIYGEA
ncbi:MAG: hypothetical protein LBU36_03205 [Clostridiales bacterium]|nr:hypothetical protein [Clostridiales bacterium]